MSKGATGGNPGSPVPVALPTPRRVKLRRVLRGLPSTSRRTAVGALRWLLFLFLPWVYNLALRRELREYRRIRLVVARKRTVLLDEPLSTVRFWAGELSDEEANRGRRVMVLDNARLTVGIRKTA